MSYKLPISKEDFEKTFREEGQKNTSLTQKKNNILKNLQEVKDISSKGVYDYASEPFKYEYLELDNTTDEQLAKLASEGILANKTQSQKDLTEKIAEQKAALYDSSMAKKDKLDEQNEQTETRYENAKNDAGKDAIRRGIGRSSIIVNLLKEYDLNKLSQIDANNENYRQEVAKIQEKINKLDSDLKSSLKELDMKSAIEINEEIERLKNERDEANQKVIKYNNQVTETLNKNKLDYMNSPALKENMEKDKERSDSLKKSITYDLLDYYGTLSYDEAIKDFNEVGYEDYLDSNQIRIIKSFLEQKK